MNSTNFILAIEVLSELVKELIAANQDQLAAIVDNARRDVYRHQRPKHEPTAFESMANADKCRSCGAEIVWLKTINGKNMPVDAETFEDGDELFEPKRHTSHFATCPDAEKFRRKK
jgi:hypothetical protein